MTIIPIILSGGSGSRLWPLSRNQYPKQYLPLSSDKTMLQETILRLNGLNNIANPIIICNREHRFLVAEQCQQIDIENPTIILEPVGRNTAPAIAVGALQSFKNTEDSVLLILSADHVIQNVEAFHQAIKLASQKAQDGKIVTFGITPTHSNTAYGYIKVLKGLDNGIQVVEKYDEKPNLETAQSYIKQGNYFWNSGMFMFKASTLIDELNTHTPEIITTVNEALKNARQDVNFIHLEKLAFETSPSISIDHALMEKSDNVIVVPLDAGWNDVGSWSTLYDISEKDSNGNVLKGDVITKGTTNTYVYASNHMITTIGLDNIIVIDTPDATLIAKKDRVNEVKSIVKSLQVKGRYEANSNLKVYRPWGWYDSIEMGEYFQVKKLHVNPWGKLSLQMHYKRAEHWVIISGTATVTNGDNVYTLEEGQSTYIPIETKHSLENKNNEKLEIIEVQSGSYLGEDDIIRFEDNYGRVKG